MKSECGSDSIDPVYLRLLQIEVSPVTAREIVDIIIDHAGAAKSLWLANHNLHSSYLWSADPHFRDVYREADMYVIDGWPVLMLARLAARENGVRLNSEHRVGSSDWLDELIARRAPLSVVAIGGTPQSSRKAAAVMKESSPWIQWRAFDGYSFEKQDELEGGGVLDDALQPGSIVLVGMGMPLQEKWIASNLSRLHGIVVANVGGCIDYIAGEQSLAPRWMGRLGLEWAYRLACDPRRLAYRYLVEPIKFSGLLVRKKFGK
ncbi:WecB/TagA/CpsF family glycosyltransferase [Prescottella equi]|uniref:WecB/TagA/CpsF family glycosyltransferase n=1 Tax=Rhodococcus hoagii TaxID=43767 RepID=UPI00111BEBDB|nr:WecB/TagA/CpsF family glycosyltransferase [Prescottella equi]